MVNASRLAPFAGALAFGFLLLSSSGCGKSEEPAVETPVAPEVPSFKGVAAGFVADGGVRLQWFAAADLQTDRGDLFYTAYGGKNGGPIDLKTPLAVSLPGATSLVLRDLEAADYRFVVRVTDSDGNQDENTSAVRVSLLDDAAPLFEGVTGVVPEDGGKLLVEWKPATDDISRDHEIRYRIYTSPHAAGVYAGEMVAETAPGATHVSLDLEDAEGEIWLGVRAVDAAGNEDQNVRVTSTLAPEEEPPVFFGLSSVEVERDGIRLKWATAVDNATASSDIVYEIYWSDMSGAQDLSRPGATTEPGAGRHLVTGLSPETRYYFIVRAVDAAKNRDQNTIQLSAVTEPADEEPPTFAGIEDLQSQSPRSLSVTWSAASDSISGSAGISYEIFVATQSGDQDFEDPLLVTSQGQTKAELINLSPDTLYFVVVRARDEAQNTDDNTEELSATTLELTGDTTAPTLGGAVKVARVPSDPTRLLVSWTGQIDDQADVSEIRAHLCIGEDSGDCAGEAFFQGYNATSAWGANSAFVSGLDPRSTYYAAVRLEDVSGNIEAKSTGAEGITATSFVRNVEPILESRCNQCHNYTYGTLVSAKEDLYVDPTYGELFLVDPTSVVESYLIRKLRAPDSVGAPFSSLSPASYYGVRMPSDGSDFLSAETEQVLIDWIDQGAFSN